MFYRTETTKAARTSHITEEFQLFCFNIGSIRKDNLKLDYNLWILGT